MERINNTIQLRAETPSRNWFCKCIRRIVDICSCTKLQNNENNINLFRLSNPDILRIRPNNNNNMLHIDHDEVPVINTVPVHKYFHRRKLLDSRTFEYLERTIEQYETGNTVMQSVSVTDNSKSDRISRACQTSPRSDSNLSVRAIKYSSEEIFAWRTYGSQSTNSRV